ncbi:MAG: DUF418 domain-containing protein [Bacteroidales bacterium]|nr:DUF418 domain-containing protein [Bacteroidales bacterium]MBN2818806.1 DUF418 domain-containing protein [Bacteroidales bacterium]
MKQNNRILIVDILRGFALLLIVLIHYVEHFDFFTKPGVNFLFSAETDSNVMEIVFFFISGKAYSIFALLFGFSFFIQLNRKDSAGIDYRATFLWRLTILMVMGLLHSLIYRGDILNIYAILGIPLILLHKANNKLLIGLSILLMLQIPFIWNIIQTFTNPDFEYSESIPTFWGEGEEAYAHGSFGDVIRYNLWQGRVSVLAWTVYNGRYLQLFALFIVGILLGRARFFENIEKHKSLLYKTLIGSVLGYSLVKLVQLWIGQGQLTDLQEYLYANLFNSYANLAFTLFYIIAIILLYLRFEKAYLFRLFASYGKMSLTNYVSQAITGVILFYGFGFALYKYLGSTWSVMIGAIVFFTQALISKWWNTKFYYGPMEWFWRALTIRDFNLKFRKGL